MTRPVGLALLFVVLGVSTAIAVEWSSCENSLDRLQRATRNASYAASEAERARSEYESAKEELESCLQFPEIYDLLEDGCQSDRYEYESARSEYEYALSNLESELATVVSRYRRVGYDCEISIASAPPSTTGVAVIDQCSAYRVLSRVVEKRSLLEFCLKNMKPAKCLQCISAQGTE